jgi:hypothetical protein
VITSLSEVEKALGAIRSLEERYRLKVGEVDQARFAFELAEIRYRAGAEDLLVVLDTQRTSRKPRTSWARSSCSGCRRPSRLQGPGRRLTDKQVPGDTATGTVS